MPPPRLPRFYPVSQPSSKAPPAVLPPANRLQAELGVLRAPTATSAASLGYSAADLEAEVSSLRRRRAAGLAAAVGAAETAAAAMAGAEAVEEGVAARQAALEQRVQAKRQVGCVGGTGEGRALWWYPGQTSMLQQLDRFSSIYAYFVTPLILIRGCR